jgi:hypothetical protein
VNVDLSNTEYIPTGDSIEHELGRHGRQLTAGLTWQSSRRSYANMVRRWILSRVPVLALVVAIGVLTAFAYASSPAPTWVSGLYDDADFDQTLGYITCETSLIDDVATGDLHPLWRLKTIGQEVLEAAAPLFLRFAERPRAPPDS